MLPDHVSEDDIAALEHIAFAACPPSNSEEWKPWNRQLNATCNCEEGRSVDSLSLTQSCCCCADADYIITAYTNAEQLLPLSQNMMFDDGGSWLNHYTSGAATGSKSQRTNIEYKMLIDLLYRCQAMEQSSFACSNEYFMEKVYFFKSQIIDELASFA